MLGRAGGKGLEEVRGMALWSRTQVHGRVWGSGESGLPNLDRHWELDGPAGGRIRRLTKSVEQTTPKMQLRLLPAGPSSRTSPRPITARRRPRSSSARSRATSGSRIT
jgi:hypothetical protein